MLSWPTSRASPRTAVRLPSVTMNGGSFMKAISAPLTSPNSNPHSSAAGTLSAASCGISETSIATTADTDRIDPTDRSMPPVRITNVMPAASTRLIDACWAMIDRFCRLAKLSVSSVKPKQSSTSTGSMPSARRRSCVVARPVAWPTGVAAWAVTPWAVDERGLRICVS
ncbi:hypothetical protein D3C72_1484250 [compost metagenome]